ncbi:MAG TPA: response regulator [Ktedonobacteraceae bacterium]|nr:response regulator [Ktedonobacteraceae bacterium]
MNHPAHLSLHGGQRARKIILIVEDDESIGELLALAITQESEYQPVVARSSRQALGIISQVKPDLLLIDCHLQRGNGLDLYDQILAIHGFEDIPAIFLTMDDEPLRPIFAQRHLASLEKPFDLDNLFQAIEDHIHLLNPASCAIS